MAKKIYDICYKSGEYQTRDGQNKGRYENVGAVFQNDDGTMFITIKATFNPAGIQRDIGHDSVILSFFTPKDKNNGNQSQSGYQRSAYQGNQRQGNFGSSNNFQTQNGNQQGDLYSFPPGDPDDVPF